MALSRAEIQQRYREKKKRTDANYKQRERERKRKAYTPVEELNSSQLKKRVQKHYQKKKSQKQNERNQESNELVTRQSSSKAKILVSLSFKSKSKRNNALRKRHSNALVLKKLKEQNTPLLKGKKTAQRGLQRLKNKSDANKQNVCLQTPSTSKVPNIPNSKTIQEMRREGLSPSTNPKIKKKLLFNNLFI
jgi:hypothetical protein